MTTIRRPRHRIAAAALAALIAAALPGCATGRDAIQTGKASYYARSFAGRRTASGERYDPRAFTAAHADLPLGTWVRVTRPSGGASVDVRINDRCACNSHIIDLSEAAARQLGMLRAGSVAVQLKVLRRPKH
ncbi:MAG TPA: septal ring lytic transglycosylase RlpA family protein [Polyangia bacterium]|nr:septal ring lytic transglycosylase RlpA family protein [Polyangia bacterium]